MKIVNSLTIALAMVVLTAALPAAAQKGAAAQETAEKWLTPGTAPYDISMGGQFLFRLREGAGGLTRDARAAWVNNRLITILQNTRLNPSDIKIVHRNGENNIIVRSKQLITVTAADAKAVNTTVNGLSKIWVASLKNALPKLHVAPMQNKGPG